MCMGIKFKATLQAVVPLNMDDAAQTPDSVKAEFYFFGGHLHPWVELQPSNDSQGTQSYPCIPHSLSFTAIKCWSLFIIYKIAKDFERFSAQAPVLE